MPINLYGHVMGLAGLSLAWSLAAKTYEISPAIGESNARTRHVLFNGKVLRGSII